MTQEALWAGPLPLWIPLLWAPEPLRHSALGSNAQLRLKARGTHLPELNFSPTPSVTFWTWQRLCAPLSGTLVIAVMGNRSSQCSFDHPLGCFTNTWINMFQTELLISSFLFHLKHFPLPVFISVSVSTYLIKPDAWEACLISSLFFNVQTTKFDDFYL